MLNFILSIDSVVNQFFIGHASSWIGTLASAVTFLANTKTIIGLVAVFVIYYFIKPNRFSIFLSSAVAVAGVVTQVLKYSVARIRPTEVLYAIQRSDYSFPSGHAVLSMVFYGFCGYYLSRFFPKRSYKILVAVITSLLIFSVGASRLVLGVHWFSDVVAGWLIGGLILGLTIRFFNKD